MPGTLSQPICLAIWIALLCAALTPTLAQDYLVGIGKGDISGPAAEVNMMGYANINQTAKGMHIRMYARAYIFAEPSQAGKRVLFVVIDAAMPSQLLTMRVVEQLEKDYQGMYTIDNTVISATHTHSSAAGYLQYMLYSLTSLGFVSETFDVLKQGILEAVKQAHGSMHLSQLSVSSGELLEANINRSPTAYLNNPQEERARYKYDTDKDMTILKIMDSTTGRGLLSWFPVHPTSMGNSNTFLSGDNKGAAEQFTEKGWGQAVAAGRRSSSKTSKKSNSSRDIGFVAAFVQPNHADTSPNIQGTFCGATEERCDVASSTCRGDNQKCLGRGPAWPNDFKSTEVLGKRMANKAEELWNAPGTPVRGPVDSRHLYFNIVDMEVLPSNFTRGGRTCVPAMGYSFAAGTTDGPGMPLFRQSETKGLNPVWSPLANLIFQVSKTQPTREQKACHGPKPILLNVGAAQQPYPFVPSVVEVSILRVGNLVSVHMPAEFTTMAGRRLREAVYHTVKKDWGKDVLVLMASVTNTYASYATTYEEYQVQRYEGGSTLYGPLTTDAYIQTAVAMATAMVKGEPVVSQVAPPDLQARQVSLFAPVLVDAAGIGEHFGEVLKDARAEYKRGEEVQVDFRSGNPRNNPRLGGTFLEVQRYINETDSWLVVHTDDDWCTRFKWDRASKLSAMSQVTVYWNIPEDAAPGKYVVKHYGDSKSLGGEVNSYDGESREFSVS